MHNLGQDTGAILSHYQRDARVYDLNRRFFLFGRKRVIADLGRHLRGHRAPRRILEVGCGTGVNLLALNDAFPRASIHGIDLSTDMLAIARQRTVDIPQIALTHQPFGADLRDEPYDLIHFSYVLSTMPDLGQSLDIARSCLAPGGHIAMVDFYSSRYELFRRWIGHSIAIRTEFPEAALHERFTPVTRVVKCAYLGVWKYFWYIGRRS